MKKLDLTGQRFGKLVVIGQDGFQKSGHTAWRCRCDCGKEVTKRGSMLKSTQSCGCLRVELGRKSLTKHGFYKLPEFHTWKRMKLRCLDVDSDDYTDYGARGIKVCERWLESFENFYADMGERPSPKHSIDRIDTNGNYEPNNCRWATPEEQANNRRSSVYLTHNGETLSAAQWARKLGMKPQAFHYQVRVKGKTIADLVTSST